MAATKALFSNAKRLLNNNKNRKLLDDAYKLQLTRCFSVSGASNMRLVQFQMKTGGPQHIGAQLSADGDVFDISAVDSSIPNNLLKFLSEGNGVVEKAKR